jgi:hypothetical protein
MGSPLSAIFSLFSGSGANTDRKNQLAGFGDLNNVFNFALPNAEAGYNAGQATQKSALSQLSSPAQYYQSLLSGNRQATQQAVAPVASAANAQADAQKKQIANSGTARGGGVNAVGQQVETNKNATVDTAINQAKQGAAAGATSVAGATSKVGDSQLSAALNLLGIGDKAATSLTSLAGDSRAESNDLHNQKAQQAATIVTQLLSLGLIPGGGGGGGGAAALDATAP